MREQTSASTAQTTPDLHVLLGRYFFVFRIAALFVLCFFFALESSHCLGGAMYESVCVCVVMSECL